MKSFKQMIADKDIKSADMTKVLTPEAQGERDEFEREYGYDWNCSCHISPPCGGCTHPGNPLNQDEDDTAWMDGEE